MGVHDYRHGFARFRDGFRESGQGFTFSVTFLVKSVTDFVNILPGGVTDSGQPPYTRTKRPLRQTTRRDPLQYGILIILFVVFSYDHVLSVLLAVIHARVGNLYDVFRSFICLIVFLKTDRYRNENVLSEK